LKAQAAYPSNSSGTGIVSSDKILRCQVLKHLERDNIVAALKRTHRGISGPDGAAEILGLNPNTLASRMRSLGIRRKNSD
jgi:transcriptional regulator with GAF, ATPase, and Fis domain